MRDTSTLDTEALAHELDEIRVRHPGSEPEMVVDVVRAVLATMQGDLSAHETALLSEVEELGKMIASARREIAALEVEDITQSHIPAATDELDAIVAHTAAATNIILEVCETLDNLATGDQGETAVALQDATTRIYEACSFQDITGQRITKVVAALKSIDAKVAQIVAAFGGRAGPSVPAPASVVPNSVDPAVIMHGPQLPATAMGQSDIDALLASFD
jgi:chemotaxis protein CheZ